MPGASRTAKATPTSCQAPPRGETAGCLFGEKRTCSGNRRPRGFYACQLRRWLALFPREQLKALVFEEFVASRADTLRAVADVETFLNVHHFDYGASW